ncbi:MAG: lysylphosphatidylglycerol synthase transmembrane domain-containing protein [Thermodesulfobacteriota bacterium]
MKKLFFLILSFLITGTLFYYLVSYSRWSDWRRLFFALDPRYLLAYLLLYAAAIFLRTVRYSILLKASLSGVRPSFGAVFLVTSVRNMLVDLLPARTGEISYPVLLNRIYRVNLYPSLTSFAYAFLFDFLALGPLFGLAGLMDSLISSSHYPKLWLFSALFILIGTLLVFGVEPFFRKLAHWLNRRSYSLLKENRTLRRVPEICNGISQSFRDLREARIFWKILGISLAIRSLKYSYLYLLLMAFVQAMTGTNVSLPFLIIFMGLVASEAAASLPISGLAGFGFYEGVLGTVLSTQGFSASQALLLSFGMHFLTHVVGYSWGGLALLLILIHSARVRRNEKRD